MGGQVSEFRMRPPDIDSSLIVGVIGLGYVGLPLAMAFAKHFNTIGYDVSAERVCQLKEGIDATGEIDSASLRTLESLEFTSCESSLAVCQVYIVAVPTPVDGSQNPDLQMLCEASRLVGSMLVRNNCVVFESTVYPGASEEICVPILERVSGLSLNKDFCLGYSPERINPGDKQRRLETIVKVTSGSSDEAAAFVDSIYRKIITAGTYRAASIKVAEAAKVIENTQRDLNIALVNEFSVLFSQLGLDAIEVFKAAETKWNYLPFRPGLVGGHCIGVDPYYLAAKAKTIGFHPELILAGRRINDGMAKVAAEKIVALMISRRLPVKGGDILVLGMTFKENCSDLRNSGAVSLIRKLIDYGAGVSVYDPLVNRCDVDTDLQGVFVEQPLPHSYDVLVLAVPHEEIIRSHADFIPDLLKDKCSIVFDVKSSLPRQIVDGWL